MLLGRSFARFRPVHALVGVALLVGCAMTPERLPSLDRRFYEVMPTPEDQRAFLKVEEEQRQDFLETHGLWTQ